MRGGCRFVKGIDGHRPEHAELDGHRFLERGATLRLLDVMRERRPWRRDAGALGLGRGGLRFGAADRGHAAFAARDALRRLMQITDRAFATDRAVIEVRRLEAEALCKLPLGITIAPAQEIDDVERADLAEQFGPSVLLRTLERCFQQREPLEACGSFLLPVE